MFIEELINNISVILFALLPLFLILFSRRRGRDQRAKKEAELREKEAAGTAVRAGRGRIAAPGKAYKTDSKTDSKAYKTAPKDTKRKPDTTDKPKEKLTGQIYRFKEWLESIDGDMDKDLQEPEPAAGQTPSAAYDATNAYYTDNYYYKDQKSSSPQEYSFKKTEFTDFKAKTSQAKTSQAKPHTAQTIKSSQAVKQPAKRMFGSLDTGSGLSKKKSEIRSGKSTSFSQKLEALPPLQQAVLMATILGRPRGYDSYTGNSKEHDLDTPFI